MLSLLETRVQEREALLGRLREMLVEDSRVLAAWMFGSYGDGREDDWSDLDLWVVLEDTDFPEIAKGRREFLRRLGDPLLYLEAPQNAPPGGAYLMSVFDAPTGPHAIDWYFQPECFARQSGSLRVLVDRCHLAPGDGSAVSFGHGTWDRTPEEDDANKAALFWVMLLVQGKCIARDPAAIGMNFEGFILSLLRDVAAFRNRPMDSTEDPALIDATEKLERLRKHGVTMAKIAPEHAKPFDGVDRFLTFVETCLS